MDSRSLATSDGSEFGAGRGSGLEAEIIPLSETQGDRTRRRTRPQVPYMMQTFAPMERRLDMAIFRAMFASSALQARQFVIHGFVQVNGKKVSYSVPFFRGIEVETVHRMWMLIEGGIDAIPTIYAQPRGYVFG
jgi:hypothetical protein